MTTFVSLAISDTMFPDNASLSKQSISSDDVRLILQGSQVLSALNPSHKSTIDVIKRKYWIDLPIPDKAPKVSLQSGDQLVVIQAQLPRLAEGEAHSQETVENAKIKFSLWRVQ
jgi:hypothetical protein